MISYAFFSLTSSRLIFMLTLLINIFLLAAYSIQIASRAKDMSVT